MADCLEAQWLFPAGLADGTIVDDLCRGLQTSRLLGSILARRGYEEVEVAARYLEPGLRHLHSPDLLHGMAAAVARVKAALRDGERILLYGDYDVDGTSALVILKTVLQLLGAHVEAFVPHRLRDGYGMKADRVRQAAIDGVRLIISVDTGIRAADVVRLATELGVDTIVTDHHLPDQDTPAAVAVVNPNQRGCLYPNKSLCGAGVAFKLAHAVLAASGWAEDKVGRLLESLLKIAALATVADIVALEGENRAIVKIGLAGLARVKNPGLRALLDVSGVREGTAPTARQVGFQIGPRINAAGRMSSASEVLELFFTGDVSRARAIAGTLDDLNRERQQTEEQMRESIFAALEGDSRLEGRMGLVLYDAGWHLGVAGIVAGRIAEKHRKPVFVLGRDEKDGKVRIKGSGRSIQGFHLLEALESMAHLFEQHGGHEQAAGLTMIEERLGEFEEAFAEYAARSLSEEMRRPKLQIEAVVQVDEVDGGLYEALNRMAPFGYGNQPPLLAVLNVEVASPPRLMKEKHVRLMVRQGGRALALKGWNMADKCVDFAPGMRIDVAFQLEHDIYDGWAATMRAVRPAVG